MNTWTIWKRLSFFQKCYNNSPLLIPSLGTFFSVLSQDQDGLEQVWQNSLSATEPYCVPSERVVCQSPHYPLHHPEYPVPSLTREWFRKQAKRRKENRSKLTLSPQFIYTTQWIRNTIFQREQFQRIIINEGWKKVLKQHIYSVVK